MVPATAPHTTSTLRILEDDQLSGTASLGGSGVAARAASPAPVESGVDRLAPRRDTLDHWSAALARGDDAEVDRLVRQSRIEGVWVAASGRLGAMLGKADSTAWGEVAERARHVPDEARPPAGVTDQIGSVLAAIALVDDLGQAHNQPVDAAYDGR